MTTIQTYRTAVKIATCLCLPVCTSSVCTGFSVHASKLFACFQVIPCLYTPEKKKLEATFFSLQYRHKQERLVTLLNQFPYQIT